MIEKIYETIGFWPLMVIALAGFWGMLLSPFIPNWGNLNILKVELISIAAVFIPIYIVYHVEFKIRHGKKAS